jgi:hypothetical protein
MPPWHADSPALLVRHGRTSTLRSETRLVRVRVRVRVTVRVRVRD